MAQSKFERALPVVLIHEGGFANHPHDPGGATMRGVTQRVYDAFRKRRGLALQSVKLISEIDIQMIYRLQYWNEIRGDDLPEGVGYVVFDAAVNSGPRRAIMWLQRAVGANLVDGQMGEATLALVANHRDHDQLIAEMLKIRLGFMQALKTWKHFGRGWSSRVADVKKRGQAWASGSVGSMPVYIEGADRKALPRDAGPRPGTGAADAAVAAGTGAGGIAGTLQQTRDQLEPLAGTSSWIGTAVAVLGIAGAALLIGGLVWRWYQTRRAAERDEALG